MQNYISRYYPTLTLITFFIDFVKDNKKKIEIFKINRPTEGQYIIMEVLGMPNGKTFQIVRLSERHTLKVVSFNLHTKFILIGQRS
jgi:hypothetical protein